jgi:hypothetical protein
LNQENSWPKPWADRATQLLEATMTRISGTMVLWSPRILGALVSVFLGAFALDAFSAGKSFADALADFVIHLIPSVVLLGVVLASWHRPLIGGLTFIALAIVYVGIARNHVEWTVVISGPLLVVGVLYLASWYGQRQALRL